MKGFTEILNPLNRKEYLTQAVIGYECLRLLINSFPRGAVPKLARFYPSHTHNGSMSVWCEDTGMSLRIDVTDDGALECMVQPLPVDRDPIVVSLAVPVNTTTNQENIDQYADSVLRPAMALLAMELIGSNDQNQL